jgi:hypothetical protein
MISKAVLSKFRQRLPDVLSARIFGRNVGGERENLRLSIKTLAYARAKERRLSLGQAPHQPIVVPLKSKLCTQGDMESEWCRYWLGALDQEFRYHRKLWELAYVAQVAWQTGKLKEGTRAIGFGCGQEPIPSLLAAHGVCVLATDLHPAQSASRGWIKAERHASSLDKLLYPSIVAKDIFDHHVSLEYVDMNDIPHRFDKKYDFVWSICALEHLGSRRNGLNFLMRTGDLLTDGGVGVHTTEFNLRNDRVVDNKHTVLFVRRDIERVAKELVSRGYWVANLDFSFGEGEFDWCIDVPPYLAEDTLGGFGSNLPHFLGKTFYREPHLKLSISGYPCTCFGIIFGKRKHDEISENPAAGSYATISFGRPTGS